MGITELLREPKGHALEASLRGPTELLRRLDGVPERYHSEPNKPVGVRLDVFFDHEVVAGTQSIEPVVLVELRLADGAARGPGDVRIQAVNIDTVAVHGLDAF